ncbi:MAG: RNA-binding S4 domain-containing protein [Alphaproteobacteria bacterium]|nr:RNA-binding S4 domain-containing protein [Alphaproteobacteria bacterium]
MNEKAVQRIDKWLWHARFFKTRGLAATIAASGRLRVNGQTIAKASYAVRPGDVLTFAQGPRVRVVKLVATAERRGPATEAIRLYEDLAPPAAKPKADEPAARAANPAPEGKPGKRDRRAIARLQGGSDPGDA